MSLCRINRILESPRGSALLVGVGGSGKQSLARLSAFISSLEVAQVQLRKGYGVFDLKVRQLARPLGPRSAVATGSTDFFVLARRSCRRCT